MKRISAAEKIRFTESDYQFLSAVLEGAPEAPQVDLLEGELSRADIVREEDIPENVVTLHSRALVRDEETATEREVTVVPPGDSTLIQEKVSVLAPLGAAVIGLSAGQSIHWPMPSGRSRKFRVLRVLYQPEASRRKTTRE